MNPAAKTATMIEQATDPAITDASCCGSARKLSGGDWGIAWGLNPVVEEVTASGSPVLRMTMNSPGFTYRAMPIPFGKLDRAALRAAMNSQYPR